MKILSDITNTGLTEDLAAKENKPPSIVTVGATSTLTVKDEVEGNIYRITASGITYTLIHSSLATGGSITIMGSGSGTSTLNTTNGAIPSTVVTVGSGQHVRCIWDGSQWLFIGNYSL